MGTVLVPVHVLSFNHQSIPSQESRTRFVSNLRVWGLQTCIAAQDHRGSDWQVQDLNSGLPDVKGVLTGPPSDTQHHFLREETVTHATGA